MVMQQNIRVQCKRCKKWSIMTPLDYNIEYWHKKMVKRSFCPICGHANYQVEEDNPNGNDS